jgi:hypothetical protein
MNYKANCQLLTDMLSPLLVLMYRERFNLIFEFKLHIKFCILMPTRRPGYRWVYEESDEVSFQGAVFYIKKWKILKC